LFLKAFVYIAILLVTFKTHSQILDHYLRCVSVVNNDSIRLQWVLPTGTGEFTNYEIFHSNSPVSGFNIINVITSSSEDEWVHREANPQATNYYFLKTNQENGIAVISDTLQAIRLIMTGLASNSIARLSWNPIHSPPIPSYNSYYKLYRKYSFTSWELLAETGNFLYYDTIVVCDDSVNYKIEIDNDNGCHSVSNIRGEWMKDLTAPPSPVFDSVSTDQVGNAILGWQPSPDSGTVAYIIYRDSVGYWLPFDTVWGIGNTIYIDSSARSCSRTRSYGMAAFDSCFSTSPRGIGPQNPGDSLRTILMFPVVFNPCASQAFIRWTHYINMIPQLASYRLYVSINNQPFQLLSEVPGTISSFIHGHLEPNTSYRYFVQAVNASKSSTSCIKGFTSWYPDVPGFVELNAATVNNQNQNELYIRADTSAYIKYYCILRKEDINDPYFCIDSLAPDSINGMTYIDSTANSSLTSYYYQVEVLDSCGISAAISNTGRTILLGVASPLAQVYELKWNYYEEWERGVNKYEVLRFNRQTNQEELVASLGAFGDNYTDDLRDAPDFSGYYFYYIRAVESDDSPENPPDTSLSNRVGVREETELYMPTAFKPSGINQEFKPVFPYFAEYEYSLQVFDRWGGMLFESNNPDRGWDGTINGQHAPLGLYAYRVSYKNFSQETVLKTGTFLLVR